MRPCITTALALGFLFLPAIVLSQERPLSMPGAAAEPDGSAGNRLRDGTETQPGPGTAVKTRRATAPAGPALTPEAKHELESLRDKVNEGIVGIVSGGIDGTYLRAATDLATVLDGAEDGLRIFPIAGKGSLENIWDIVFARGVDVGLVQSDVLAYAEREKIFPKVGTFIQYVSPLYGEEVHVLARKDIAKIGDLAAKKVNVDGRHSGTYLTANVLFKELKIPVELTTDDQALALEKLKRGEIAALVYVAGKPVRLFADLKPEDNLHFLSVPTTPELQRIYFSSYLDAQDYPNLIDANAAVPVVGVEAVLAVYAWPPQSPRYRKVARFVDAFFSHLAAFQKPPRHPKWHEVSHLVLAQPLPGWTRFPEAEKWLKSAALTPHIRQEFDTFLEQTRPGDAISPEDREALFAEYMQRQAGPDVASGSSIDPRLNPGQSTGDGAAEPSGAGLRLAPDVVKQVQSALQAQGLYTGAIDGIVGPETTRAIDAFQQTQGRPQTTMIDLETLRTLTGN